jgi:hypothetical protein
VVLLQSIPVPFSLLTLIGSVVSLANICQTAEQSLIVAVIAVLTMLFSGSYSVTYLFSAVKTLLSERITFLSFLPLVHLAVTVMLFVLWPLSEKVFS